MNKIETTNKKVVVKKANNSKKFWMSKGEYTGILVGKESTDSQYVISDGVIEPGGFVPDHYHKWEDQTFHILSGNLTAKIGNHIYEIQAGDSIHCPRGVSHYIKNSGTKNAHLISYIFPGDLAEDFMKETSKQVESENFDLQLIKEKFGVVYLNDN